MFDRETVYYAFKNKGVPVVRLTYVFKDNEGFSIDDHIIEFRQNLDKDNIAKMKRIENETKGFLFWYNPYSEKSLFGAIEHFELIEKRKQKLRKIL